MCFVWLNKYYLRKKGNVKYLTYDLLIVFNMLSFLPFALTYYYWDLADYNSSGIFIIYILVFGIILRFNSVRLILLTLYFFCTYFGMIYYVGIPYTVNQSLYLNGIAALVIFYFLSRTIYDISLQSVSNKILVQEKNEKLELVQDDLQKTLSLVNEQNYKLEESNRNLLNFANVAAHDIKAPLRTISSFTSLLSIKYRDAFMKEDLNLQDTIVKSCDGLTKLVDGVLEFSKISTDERRCFSQVDLSLLIKDILFLLNDHIIEKNVRLSIQSDFPIIEGVKELLQQLFINLISNAIKFSAKDIRPEVALNYYLNQNNEVIICIKDNGIGIPEPYQYEIFQLFKKLNSSKDYEGNGLGLAISKRIVEKHSGSIRVATNKPKGSSFFVTLPLQQK